LFFFCLFFSHRLVAEESDSDSDEDLEGGVRHDLMMADEKVYYVKILWRHPRVTQCLNPLGSGLNIQVGFQLVLATWLCKTSLLELCRSPAGVMGSLSFFAFSALFFRRHRGLVIRALHL